MLGLLHVGHQCLKHLVCRSGCMSAVQVSTVFSYTAGVTAVCVYQPICLHVLCHL